jgi:hypothetical protein
MAKSRHSRTPKAKLAPLRTGKKQQKRKLAIRRRRFRRERSECQVSPTPPTFAIIFPVVGTLGRVVSPQSQVSPTTTATSYQPVTNFVILLPITSQT